MSKRVFIAAPVSLDLSKKISEWVKTNLDRSKIRPILGKNLHITLVPPWYMNNSEEVLRKLSKLNYKKKIKIIFEKIEYGPTPKHPRLVWLQGKDQPDLLVLKKILERSLHQKSEKRKFLVHLTIARFKPNDFKVFGVKDINVKINWAMDINQIFLYESHLSSKGADYEILAKIPLSNGPK